MYRCEGLIVSDDQSIFKKVFSPIAVGGLPLSRVWQCRGSVDPAPSDGAELASSSALSSPPATEKPFLFDLIKLTA